MNLGDCSLTNVLVVSSLPGENTQVFGPITLARGEARSFFANYTVGPTTPPVNVMKLTASGTAPCSGLFVTAEDNCAGNVVGNPPVLTAPVIGTETVSLSWSANAGITYRVQSRASLLTGSWQDEAGDVVAQGSTADKNVSKGSDQQRYFRIMIVP